MLGRHICFTRGCNFVIVVGNVASSTASIDYEQSLFTWSVEQNARDTQMENGVLDCKKHGTRQP